MKKLSAVLIIISGMLWGSMGVFSTELNAMGFDSLQGSSIRLITCSLVFILMYFTKLKIELKDIWKFASLGILSILTMSVSYFESIKRSSLTLASILLYTAPVMVMMMSAIFYKEKITLRKLFCLVIALLGIIMISGLDSSITLTFTGLMFGIISGFSYALYSIIGKVLLKKYQPITVSAYAFIFAALGSVIICDASDIVNTVKTCDNIIYVISVMCACGIITAAIPYTLYTVGLKYVPAGKASVLACAEPVTASVIGISFYGDRPGLYSCLGIVLILTAVIILSISPKD